MPNSIQKKDTANALTVIEGMVPALVSLFGAMKPELTASAAIANVLLAGIAVRSVLAGKRAKELQNYLEEYGEQLIEKLHESENMRILVWNLIERFLRENSKQKRHIILNAITSSAVDEFMSHEDWHSRIETVLNQIDMKEVFLLKKIMEQEQRMQQSHYSFKSFAPKFLDNLRYVGNRTTTNNEEDKREWLARLYALGNYGLIVIQEAQTNLPGAMREMTELSMAGITPSETKERDLPQIYITDFGRFFIKELLRDDVSMPTNNEN